MHRRTASIVTTAVGLALATAACGPLDPLTPVPPATTATTTPAPASTTTTTTTASTTTTTKPASTTTTTQAPTFSTTTTQPASTTSTTKPPSTTSTTSTEKPPSDGEVAVDAVTTVVAALPPDPRAAALALRESNGPPDVATSPLLPGDSLAAATAELDVLRAIAGQLVAVRPQFERAAQLVEATRAALASAHDSTDAARDRMRTRRARALLDAGRRRTVDGRSDLASERLLVLTRAATRALERRLADLDLQHRRNDEQAGVVAAALQQNAAGLVATDAEIAQLTAKLTSGELVNIDPATLPPSDPGLGAVARAAREAEIALVAGDDAAARRRLADAVGAEVGRDGAAFDAVWASTPGPARRATYFALSQVGKPYVYATTGPATYDCSGLTRRAWQQSGISLPHFSGAQLHTGTPVAPAAVRPGDLLTYGPDGADHVVLAIGLGFDVEAKGRDYGVVIDTADTDAAGGRFSGASRPVP